MKTAVVSGMDFFLKDKEQDDALLARAAPDGDLDMIISPIDGKLVVVSQINGVHSCSRCHEQFVNGDPAHADRPVEYNPGGEGTRILLHARCVRVKPPRNIIHNLVRGHQIRRFLTKALKPFMQSSDSKVSL
jgi:hypothetical protein